MNEYRELISHFVQQNKEILGANLVGVYLHDSAVMGCFNSQAPAKGIELSIVKENVCSPFAYQRPLSCTFP